MSLFGSPASTKRTFLTKVAGDVLLVSQACETAKFILQQEWQEFPVEIARRLLGDFDKRLAMIEGLSRPPQGLTPPFTKAEADLVKRVGAFGRLVLKQVKEPLAAASFAADHTAPEHNVARLNLTSVARDLPEVHATGEELTAEFGRLIKKSGRGEGTSKVVKGMLDRTVLQILLLIAGLLVAAVLTRCSNDSKPEVRTTASIPQSK